MNDTVEKMLNKFVYCADIAAISAFCFKRTGKTNKIFVLGDVILYNLIDS